ncbi:MAG TPA: 4a-hydroxytetrahydrobiopterin dehydratase [Methylomirabilota bacterium]|nr:4a-hydroxytetrahydrobiopterin dehydratase [Methylomirabilota bacterium]
MPRPARLTEEEIARRLETLPGWRVEHGKLHKAFVFKDFAKAFAFMTDVAWAAEEFKHHPEWFNVYNRVTMDLVTHDAKGITALDFELAARAQTFAERHT